MDEGLARDAASAPDQRATSSAPDGAGTPMPDMAATPMPDRAATPMPDRAARSKVLRDALAVGAATGAYGISFGAISVASGLNVTQTAALSVLLFSGGSQFALVGVLGAGGSAGAAVAAAGFLGVRNAFYGVRLASMLRVRPAQRPVAAQLVIDESTAMAIGQESPELGRLAFWSTGVAIYVLWNLMTVVGAIAGSVLASPETLGLDAAAPAAFLALLWPRLQGRLACGIAALGAAIGLALTPLTPPGMPVLVVAAVVVVLGWWQGSGATSQGLAAPDATADAAPDAAADGTRGATADGAAGHATEAEGRQP